MPRVRPARTTQATEVVTETVMPTTDTTQTTATEPQTAITYGPTGDGQALVDLYDLAMVPDWVPLAVDTETNALYADDLARVSVVSVAWVEPERLTGTPEGLREAIATGRGVRTVALPFSQGWWLGRTGVKTDKQVPAGLTATDPANPNLPEWAWEQVLEVLRRHRLVFHHGKFDAEKLRYAPIGWSGVGVDLLGNWEWDTQVTAPEIWPGHTSSLKPTSARLWGVDSTAEAEAIKPYLGKKTDPRYDLVPWEVLGPYAAKDTELTIRLYYLQQSLTVGFEDEPWAYDARLLAQCKREVQVARALYRMERAGIPYDADESRRIGAALTAHKTELEKQLPFRPTDPAAKTWLFGELDERGNSRAHPISVTSTGAPSLTADVVLQMIGKHPEGTEVGDVMRVWAQRGKIATAVKMWYLPYAAGLGADGRLRTCFRQVTRGRGTVDGGTRSGRFSVERINLQAIPHDYRLEVVTAAGAGFEVKTPRQLIGLAASRLTGWQQWEFDLAQAELRVAAAWAGCTPMLDALREKRDLHSETTRELFGIELDDPEWGHFRQIGKRANFTLCFGAGGDTLARMVLKETGRVMSRYQAQTLVRDWNDLYPQYRQAIRLWQGYADQTGEVPLASVEGFASGRKRRFTPDEETHKAFNQIVQGSLAEFLKDWLLAAQQICDDAGLGLVEGIGWTGVVLTIHDSIVALLPSGEDGQRIADRIQQAASDLWQRYFNTPDRFGRVEVVDGFAEAKKWGGV